MVIRNYCQGIRLKISMTNFKRLRLIIQLCKVKFLINGFYVSNHVLKYYKLTITQHEGMKYLYHSLVPT